jgi:hypothetical protein
MKPQYHIDRGTLIAALLALIFAAVFGLMALRQK